MNKTDFLKALSDPTRLSIVLLLTQKQSMCVCDIISQLKHPQPTISRHLTQLKQVGILESERRGTWMWYSVNPALPQWAKTIVEILMNT